MESTEQSTERASVTAGLRELADFLDAHPAVPLPSVSVYGSYSDLHELAAWVDGLDTLEVTVGILDTHRAVVRRFAGLTVKFDTMRDLVGIEVERPAVAMDLVLFTPAEIVARAEERVSA